MTDVVWRLRQLASLAALFLRRQVMRPITLAPTAKNGNAAGSGTGDGGPWNTGRLISPG